MKGESVSGGYYGFYIDGCATGGRHGDYSGDIFSHASVFPAAGTGDFLRQNVPEFPFAYTDENIYIGDAGNPSDAAVDRRLFFTLLCIWYQDFSFLPFYGGYPGFFAEIYRGGIESMSVGQYEAAQVLGYSKVQTFCKIILPQVVKRILPSITNETITLVKDTSLAFVLAVVEMFTAAKQIAAKETTILPLMAAGVFYYIFNLAVATFMEYLEKRMSYYR